MGESKLIPVLHGQVALQSARARVGRAMPLSSIEHSYAKRQFLYAVHEGATVAHRGTPATPVAPLCAALGVDVVGCMNVQALGLIADAARFGRLPATTVLRTSGSRAAPPFRRDLLAHVCDAVEISYSMQECGSIASIVERDAAAVTESVGRPHAGVTVEIVDEDGKALPQGETGEIRIRAPGMATHYLDDERATARHFRDGWLCPGDLGTFTREGTLVVHGRADDVMIMNDIKIAPAEIERVLERHPSVRAVAAFAVRSPVHGEVPLAAVELLEGAAADERELQAYARDALGLRAPRRVMIVASLPSTPLGKVDTRRLAEMALASVSPGGVMALKSTVFKAELSVADIDRGVLPRPVAHHRAASFGDRRAHDGAAARVRAARRRAPRVRAAASPPRTSPTSCARPHRHDRAVDRCLLIYVFPYDVYRPGHHPHGCGDLRGGTRSLYLETTASTSRAERIKYSSLLYLISVPPYLL